MQYLSMKWKRPFSLSQVEDALVTLAETRPRGMVVFEIRKGTGSEVQYLIGAKNEFLPRIKQAFKAHGDVRFGDAGNNISRTRPLPTSARMLKITRPNLALNTEIAEGMLRAGLSTLSQLPKGETAVIQIILGAAHPPAFSSSYQYDPEASWLDVVLGKVNKASSEQLKSIRNKAGQYSYDAVIRVGAGGKRAESTINSLTGVYRTMSSAGVRIKSCNINPDDITNVTIPWRMPLKLSASEIAMSMLLPTGTEEYAGVKGIHPQDLSLPNWYHSPAKPYLTRGFAVADDGASEDTVLSISPRDALEHTMILGPTGAGKSTVMLNLILSDIKAGRSVMVIDPKADLVNDILARMPEKRLDDLVVIDPADDNPVGWNPLEIVWGQNDTNAKKHQELVADAILAVLKDIFDDNWGIRAQDILSAGLLTLAGKRDATLMWLPQLLTDTDFRKRVTKGPMDEIALRPFWEQYDAMKESERRTITESSLNKIRQIMFRPGLRNILGQAHPKFHLSELFTEKKVVLVPLNKGLIGGDSARLLGSLLVGMTWIEVLKRANIPKEKRSIVSMYIDELQDYVSLPGSFADALAQARGLGLAITVAHQYQAQLTNNLKEGIDANCRNKIIFGLSSSDASSVTHLSGELKPIDFMSLPRYHIYANFMVDGRSTGFVSGITRPAEEPLRLPVEAKAISQKRYGKPSKEVEQEILSALFPADQKGSSGKALDPSGKAEEIAELSRGQAKVKTTIIGVKPEAEEDADTELNGGTL